MAAAGKFLIAHYILKAERTKSSLRVNWEKGDGAIDLAQLESDWLHTFTRMLFANVRKAEIQSLTKLNIVCFNYDRCIERYLIEAIRQGYETDYQIAHGIVARMNILHPYGHLGPLPVAPTGHGPDVVPYGAEMGRVNLRAISQRIKTFTEVVDQNLDDQLKTMVRAARRVVFMGFAFHSPNVKLLTVKSDNTFRRAYSTGVRISSQEKVALKGICHSMLGVPATAVSEYADIEIDQDCKRLLEVHRLNLLAS